MPPSYSRSGKRPADDSGYSPKSKKANVSQDYYDILGIPKTATAKEIKQAWKREVLKWHPDKNKSAEAEDKIKQINKAYEILSNNRWNGAFGSSGASYHESTSSQSRNTNDGKDGTGAYGFRWGSGGGGDGGASTQSKSQQQKPPVKDEPVFHDILVSLEDVLLGAEKKMKITKTIVDTQTGQYRVEDKTLSVTIKPGWKEGTKITFSEEGDQFPGRVPADVVFIVKDKPHAKFKRDGNNVLCTVNIPLRDALCGGVTVPAPMLQGGVKQMKIPRGTIIEPGRERRVRGLGLPFSKQPTRYGDLIVKFNVVFPSKLPNEMQDMLRCNMPAS